MTTLSIKSYFQRTRISLTEKDTLIYEKKTALGHRIETIPLISFSPEIKSVKKNLGVFAKWLLQIGWVLTVYFLVHLFHKPLQYSITNLSLFLSLLLTFLICATIYYFYKTQNRLNFYFNGNETAAFIIPSLKDKTKEKQFIEAFNLAVRNARVNDNQNDLILLEKGIDSLEKQSNQQIIR